LPFIPSNYYCTSRITLFSLISHPPVFPRPSFLLSNLGSLSAYALIELHRFASLRPPRHTTVARIKQLGPPCARAFSRCNGSAPAGQSVTARHATRSGALSVGLPIVSAVVVDHRIGIDVPVKRCVKHRLVLGFENIGHTRLAHPDYTNVAPFASHCSSNTVGACLAAPTSRTLQYTALHHTDLIRPFSANVSLPVLSCLSLSRRAAGRLWKASILPLPFSLFVYPFYPYLVLLFPFPPSPSAAHFLRLCLPSLQTARYYPRGAICACALGLAR
jgi:hypothetical protein